MFDLITTQQLADLVGVSYRRIDYWTRNGVLLPDRPATGSGSQRLYHPSEVKVARLVARLVELGCDCTDLVDVVAELRCQPDDVWAGWVIVLDRIVDLGRCVDPGTTAAEPPAGVLAFA